jgi:predicted O-methyltransferase YrrM
LTDIGSIQQTARGFMESRVLLTGVELNLFSLLAAKAMTADQVASELEANIRGTTMLLDALAAFGYLTKEGCVYRTEPSVIPLLTNDSPNSILPGMMHTAYLWHGWSQLTDIVLKGGHAEFPGDGRERRRKAFIGAMGVRAAQDAHQLVNAVKAGNTKSLLDVGGASGGYTVAFLEEMPGMKATIFDLPPVIEMARDRLSQTPWMERVNLVAGDFTTDELPGGHDLALLSAIIHMNSHEQNLDLYRKVYAALNQGGRVIIRDFVMEPDRTRPVPGALFAINMLVNTNGGGTYTFDEIRDGLEEAGFIDVGFLENQDGFSIVQGFKAEQP